MTSIIIINFLAERPHLLDLRSFYTSSGKSIDMAEHIAPNRKEFGTCLLNDDDGVAFKNIESSFGPHAGNILNELFVQWLSGRGKRPETWATFVICLRVVRLHFLADSIEDVYDLASVKSTIPKPAPSVAPTPSVQRSGLLTII